MGLTATAVVLTGCASATPHQNSSPAAGDSPSPSYVVYPAPGTAAVEDNPICQLAHNTAVPAAKRSSANDECDQLLSHATEPVTKPVVPTTSATAAPLQPSAADCLPDSLRARFRGGGYGSGNDFGEILIWNTQPQPCTIQGPVAFAAYLSDGTADQNATTNRTISIAATTLPANMPAPQRATDPSALLIAGLMGLERDDPTQPNGLCHAQDEQTPATLVLTLGALTLRVRNEDTTGQVTGIYGCHGRVLLQDITAPSTS